MMIVFPEGFTRTGNKFNGIGDEEKSVREMVASLAHEEMSFGEIVANAVDEEMRPNKHENMIV